MEHINLGWIWGGGGGYVTRPDSDDEFDYEWGD